MDAPVEQQRTLVELQGRDSAVDRLTHRRHNLPEHAKLDELGQALDTIDQLNAERQGTLATLGREQARLEHDIDSITRKAASEEARAVSGKVTSPKELTAIQDELAALGRRKTTLEDELLEKMEQRETLDGEVAELTTRRESVAAEQAEVTKARDAALADIDHELEVERGARATLAARISAELLTLYQQIRARQGGVGAGALLGNTCQGCHVSLSPVELAALRKLPSERVKRCENCRRILVIE